jgi:uncharacterized repeat protein (TIGR02543 family)
LVTFNTGDKGSEVEPKTIIAGDTVARPEEDPTRRDGYVFGGWFSNETYEMPYNFDTPVTGPLTIYAKWNDFSEISKILSYLNATYGGYSVYNPVALKLDFNLSGNNADDLTDYENNLLGLLVAIDTAGKYVELDLSECTMNGTAFGSGLKSSEYFSKGKDKIVSLTLPDSAITIEEGSLDFPTFKYFTALQRVSGEKIKYIKKFAFTDCYALEEANFPETTTIGEKTFQRTALKEAIFPDVETIENYAFQYAALKKADLGSESAHETDIGIGVFHDCTALEEVKIPNVKIIEVETFYNCRALKEVDLESATTIGIGAFKYCDALETVKSSSVKIINTEAFYGCRALKEADFSGVTTIDDYVFEACGALGIVKIPNVIKIGNSIFRDTGSTELVITLNEFPTLTSTTGLFPLVNIPKTVTVMVPSSALDGTNASGWPLSFKGSNDNIKLEIKSL